MVCAHGELVPCLVIKVEFEFRDQELGDAKMTVVRVNGDMRNVVDIDIDAVDDGFKITSESITYEKA